MKKKVLAMTLALVIPGCMSTVMAAEEALQEIELGSSGVYMSVPEDYAKGELGGEDTNENQVAYYQSESSLVDFDVYQWAKADGETLESAAAEEAAQYEAEAEMVEKNGMTLAYYAAEEDYEGTVYTTGTYIAEAGDNFVELVFWMDGDTAADEVEAMLATLTVKEEEAAEAGVIVLGTSEISLAPEKAYEKAELSAEDTNDNQVAYYASEESKVDFDVYQWAKADGETLESAAAEEAAQYEAEVEMTEINGIELASYTTEEEYEGTTYTTVTYLAESGDDFVEVVFWLDGETAAEEVDAIMATISK